MWKKVETERESIYNAKNTKSCPLENLNSYNNLPTAPNVKPVNLTLPPGYVTKDLNNIQNRYRVIMNPVTQRPNKIGISTKHQSL